MTDQKIEKLLELAKKHGADAADVLYIHHTNTDVRILNGKPEAFETAISDAIGLRVFFGQQQSVGRTSQLTPSSIANLAEQVCSMAQATPANPHVRMATQEEVQKSHEKFIENIDIYCDEPSPDAEKLQKEALKIEALGLDIGKISKSGGAWSSSSSSAVKLVGSNGFSGAYQSTFFSKGVELIAGSGSDMVTGWAYESRHHLADMPTEERIAAEAGEKALSKMGGKPISSATMPIVFDRKAASTLLGHLAGAINGQSIVRGTSFLQNKMGEPIFAKGVHIFDDPLLRRGHASKPFDAEGLPVEKRAIIEEGVLKTWLLDITTANQLNLTSTGSAGRGAGSLPSPSTSNFYMAGGNASPEELIADIKYGLFVTSLMGNAVNPLTGDYSRGAEGRLIENGKLTKAVVNVTIAGNLLDMYKNITPANDLVHDRSIACPTLVIQSMAVAGV